MAVKIRLSRAGTKKRPYYHIVVADSRTRRDGVYIEKIGSFNPLLDDKQEKRVVLNAERAKHWVGVGAQLSDRVHRFLKDAGVVNTTPLLKTANLGMSKKAVKKAEDDKKTAYAAAKEAAKTAAADAAKAAAEAEAAKAAEAAAAESGEAAA